MITIDSQESPPPPSLDLTLKSMYIVFFRSLDATLESVWIGYNEQLSMWEDGTLVSWSNWFPGEPDDVAEECVLMLWPYFNWKWGDFMCTRAAHGLCQIKISEYN